MEVYFAATGEYQKLKLFEAQMQGQLFNLRSTNPKGYTQSLEMYGILEPINLYRYVFPKEVKDIVLTTLATANTRVPVGGLPLMAMRKALRLQPIDGKYTELKIKMPVLTKNLWVVPIGMREDPEKVFKETGIKQEAI